MFSRESIPYAPALVESMRSLGYSFESAIADLLDNSISANASEIKINLSIVQEPELLIIDNGFGMTESELEEAMRYGSQNPLEERNEADLGRFGLGLKSASLSQCRNLLVISKKENHIAAFSWDLDYIIQSKNWVMKGYEEEEILSWKVSQMLSDKKSGTIVIWKDFDRVEVSTNNIFETLTKYLNNTIDHLALVFHRFIHDGLNIYVNNLRVDGRDPFLLTNKKTQFKREQSFVINESKITVKPYILPHISDMTQAEIKMVGGKDSLRTEQGFYIYRNRRLIIWGTWFRLEHKDELNKLARVMVDIPNSLDYMWSIDIKKSSANLPDIIKRNLYNCIAETTDNSKKVHTYRGRKEQSNIEYVWERVALRDGYQYKINRKLPVIGVLKNILSTEQMRMVENLLDTIEQSFPSSTLYVDVAKGEYTENISNSTKEVFDKVMEQVTVALKINMNVRNLLVTFMNCEPYCLDKKLMELLKEEIKKYE